MTLIYVKLHAPSLCPDSRFVQIFLKNLSLYTRCSHLQINGTMMISCQKCHLCMLKNSNGPTTLPYGTPLVALIGLEGEPPHTTRWVCNNKNQKFINGYSNAVSHLCWRLVIECSVTALLHNIAMAVLISSALIQHYKAEQTSRVSLKVANWIQIYS